jgi:hypothetical protein
MTESLIKINGFPPIILANFAFANGDRSRRKPLIWKDGMILAESCPGVGLVPLTGTSSRIRANCRISPITRPGRVRKQGPQAI